MNKLLITIISLLFLLLQSCYLARVIIVNVPTAKDYKNLPKHKIKKPAESKPFFFTYSKPDYLNKIDSISYDSKNYLFDDFLEEHKTQAFLIIHNDKIVYEKYFNHSGEMEFVTSFSISKSVISALIGIAIDEGLIKSEFEPITAFLSELQARDSSFSKIKIQDLLQMRSGLWLNENFYNPFSDIGKAYFGRNLTRLMKKLKIDKEPGVSFNYFNYNTQLLAFILEKVTGKTVVDYLQEKIWEPLSMESDASWSIDSRKHGNVKAYCCINAIARDYAKFGRLFLHKGVWEGKRIISDEWVEKSTNPIKDGPKYYGYQWWLNNSYKSDFLAAGILGQYIYVYPDKNLIMLRFGKSKDGVSWEKVFKILAEQIN